MVCELPRPTLVMYTFMFHDYGLVVTPFLFTVCPAMPSFRYRVIYIRDFYPVLYVCLCWIVVTHFIVVILCPCFTTAALLFPSFHHLFCYAVVTCEIK